MPSRPFVQNSVPVLACTRPRALLDAPTAFAASLLIPALPDFQREYPDITLALGISDRPVNIVGEGVECVIRAGTIDELSMVGRKLLDLSYITCAAPAYLT